MSGWTTLVGNDRLKQQLSCQEESRGLSHAYLLTGPKGSGRHTLARLLAAALVCRAAPNRRPCGQCVQCKKAAAGIHPDIIAVSGPGEGKPITVDQVRALRADAYIRPNEGERKVYLLEQAELMNASAQNAMLKLLEEGPPYAVFLLLSENAGGLLQTVRSRCELLALSPVSLAASLVWLREKFPNRSDREIQQATQDCEGILGRAVLALEGLDSPERAAQAAALAAAIAQGSEWELMEASMVLEKVDKDQVSPLLEQVRVLLVERMRDGGGKKRLLRGVDLLTQLRQGAALNANPGQLAGWLCAGMFFQDKINPENFFGRE